MEPLQYAKKVSGISIPTPYVKTPLTRVDALGQVIAGEARLKDETQNPIKSFKGRGAFQFFSDTELGGAHVVCASAGNFGQGMAVAGRHHGCPVTVFASKVANPIKVARMRELGASVIQVGADFDQAKDAARQWAAEHGYLFVEDGAHDAITDGASTLSHEILEEWSEVQAIVLPLGNGALVAGAIRARDARGSPARIIAVSARGAPAMARSLRSGDVEQAPALTIADGIAVRCPVESILPELRAGIDDLLEVSEEEIVSAMRFVYRHHVAVTEPAGVVGVAALMAYPEYFRGQSVATALCGANVSPEVFHDVFGSERYDG